MELKEVIPWAIAGVTILILCIFALIVFLKRKTIFRYINMKKLNFFPPVWSLFPGKTKTQ